MVTLRRELYPPESKMHRKEFEETIRKMRAQQEREQLAMLEEDDEDDDVYVNMKVE